MVSNNFKKLSSLTLASLLIVSLVTVEGCRKAAPVPSPSAAPLDPTPPVQEMPGDNDNDGQSDLPQEPVDIPEPLPAPTQPVNPGQPITAKAIGKTTSYVLPFGGVNGTYVNVEVTWQPVNGAKEYLLFKNILPTKEQVSKGQAYKIIKADGLLSTYFLDGAQPPSFQGGNIWDKIKKGFGGYTLKPGVEYKYKVFALDMDGNVIGESDAATTIPLPPIAAPADIKVSETHTTTPLFEWASTNGVAPDGYYVSVHPPILFGKQAATQQGSFGYAYWSTFRKEQTKVARYGSQSDNLAAYPGTLPFNVNFGLKMQNRYSVSITGVKTDTNDMRTARAISKSWSDSKMFTVGMATAPTPTTPGSGTADPNAPAVPTPSPSASSSTAKTIWEKTKSLVGGLFG